MRVLKCCQMLHEKVGGALALAGALLHAFVLGEPDIHAVVLLTVVLSKGK